MLLVPAWGTRSPSLQDGAPIHRVRAHSLTGIRNSTLYLHLYYVYMYYVLTGPANQYFSPFRIDFFLETREQEIVCLLSQTRRNKTKTQ